MFKVQKLILSEKDLFIFLRKMKRNGALPESRPERSIVSWAQTNQGATCPTSKYRYVKRFIFKFKKMLSDDYYLEIRTQSL